MPQSLARVVLHITFSTITIAKLLEEVKSSSSEWLKRDEQGVEDFYWQNGYCAFSVGESGVGGLQQYIANQEEHHRKVTFQEEFRSLLERHNIPYDERYVWD
jgi:putative transposase